MGQIILIFIIFSFLRWGWEIISGFLIAAFYWRRRIPAFKAAAAHPILWRELSAKNNKELQSFRKQRFHALIKRYVEAPEVQKMGEFLQHGHTTTLEHCKNVAWISFMLNERLHLNADEQELVGAAMLHDFYLYDWHDGKPARKTHGFDHPYIASINAAKTFGISEHTKSSIKSHMWPLNITEIPKTREAIILCLVDKYSAVLEVIRDRA